MYVYICIYIYIHTYIYIYVNIYINNIYIYTYLHMNNIYNLSIYPSIPPLQIVRRLVRPIYLSIHPYIYLSIH